MPLELINGRLVQVDKKVDVPALSLPDAEAQSIIEAVDKIRQPLQVPEYVPDDRRNVVLKYLIQLEDEVWQQAVNKWKTSSSQTQDGLLSRYQNEMKMHFLSTGILIPAKNPLFITENTYAIGSTVTVENVVNCTGGILKGDHHVLGFHILGFTQIGNARQPILPESAEKVGWYIDQMLDLLGEPPKKITLHASTLGKGIDNLDVGHNFVERLIREKLAQKYPGMYPNPKAIEIGKVRSINLSSAD